jgi:hypothetical protein
MGSEPPHDDLTGSAGQVRLRHDSAAEHAAGIGLEHMREECRRTLRAGQGPHYLARYTNGIYDFDLDVLDSAHLVPRRSAAHVREDCLGVGRQLSMFACRLGRTLEDVRTGALIRIVLHSPDGVCFCNSVLPQHDVVGVLVLRTTTGRSSVPQPTVKEVESADMAVANLVTTLREQVSQGPQNPGGWTTRRPDDRTPGPAIGQGEQTSAGRPHVAGQWHGSVATACLKSVNALDLHYVAYYRQGELVFTADHFDHERLRPFFMQQSANDRREFYEGFGQDFGLIVSQLTRTCAPVLSGPLGRVVLDVEQGALYYYRVKFGEYLVGVTLDQSRVSHADEKLAQLAVDCESMAVAS